jgi:hypothetical protein
MELLEQKPASVTFLTQNFRGKLYQSEAAFSLKWNCRP